MLDQQMILDRYRVIGRAGAGGYAMVIHAFDTRLKRDVAIKCIQLSYTDVIGASENARRRQAQARGNMPYGGFGEGFDSPDLPGEPGFLRSRGMGQADARGDGRRRGGRAEATTTDIRRLASFLPGEISGAGKTPISSIDNSKVRMDPSLLEEGQQAPSMAFRGGRYSPRGHEGYDDAGQFAPSMKIAGLEEARTAAHLNDANIVTVYDCVVEGGMAYVIMEYIEGKTLARILRELDNEITLDMVTNVFISVAHALEVAHKAGILHLDIKPENVVINREGVVKVTDFGLSTLMDASGQGTTGGGTIGYMPLEQMRQQQLDVRTDEWALASLTYEMLSGTNPFRATSLRGAENAILDAELVLPSLCWDIDETVDDVIFRALDPEMEERYESISDFADDLTPYLSNARSGKKQLAEAVKYELQENDAYEEEPDARKERGRRAGILSRLSGFSLSGLFSGNGLGIANRIVAALSAAMISIVSMINFRAGASDPTYAPSSLSDPSILEGSPDQVAQNVAQGVADNIDGLSSAYSTVYGDASVFGLFSMFPIVAWILLAVFVAVAAIRPRFGMPLAFLGFFIMLAFNQAWTSAVIVLVGVIAWWWYFGRFSDELCAIAMIQPLAGSVGFSALAPVIAGAMLDIKEVAAVMGITIVNAFVFASLGSCDITNWEVYSNFVIAINPAIAGASISHGLAESIMSPLNWVIAASWLLGAEAFSLLCRQGSRTFDILGASICAIFVIIGVFLAPVLSPGSGIEPLMMAGAVLSGIAGVALAVAGFPDKVRLVPDDGYGDGHGDQLYDYVGEGGEYGEYDYDYDDYAEYAPRPDDDYY